MSRRHRFRWRTTRGGLLILISLLCAGSVSASRLTTEPSASPSPDPATTSVELTRLAGPHHALVEVDIPARDTALEPVFWEWDTLTAHAEHLGDRLPSTPGKRPMERLFPYLPMMSSSGRSPARSWVSVASWKSRRLAPRPCAFPLMMLKISISSRSVKPR